MRRSPTARLLLVAILAVPWRTESLAAPPGSLTARPGVQKVGVAPAAATAVVIPYQEELPFIDGDITDLQIPVSIDTANSKAFLAWNEHAIYAALYVNDGSLVSTSRTDGTSTDAAILTLGGVELFFSSSRGNAPVFKRFKQGALDYELFHLHRGEDGTTMAVRRAEEQGEVVYEAAIPWASLDDSLPLTAAALPARYVVRNRQGRTATDAAYSPPQPAGAGLELTLGAASGPVWRVAAATPVTSPGQVPGLCLQLRSAAAVRVASVSVAVDGGGIWSGELTAEAGMAAWTISGVELAPGSHRVEVRAPALAPAAAQVVSFDRAALRRRLDAIRLRLAKLPLDRATERVRRDSACAVHAAAEAGRLLARAHVVAREAEDCLEQAARAESMLTDLEAGRPVLSGQTGLVIRAHRSTIDDTVQPYALYVPRRAATGPRPLVLALPDAGEDAATPLRDDGLARAAETHGFLVASTSGRRLDGRYTGAARVDVFEVLEDVTRVQAVDPARVFVAGSGFGGTAALEFGLENPERFLGMAALNALPDRVAAWTAEWKKEPPPWLATLLETHSAALHAINGTGKSVFLAFQSTTAQKYKQQADALAAGLLEARATVKTVELSQAATTTTSFWSAALAQFAAAASRPSLDSKVVFATTRLSENRCAWVRIDELRAHGSEATIRAERSKDGIFKVELQNVLAFSLSTTGTTPPPEGAFAVSVDAQTVTTHRAASGWLHLRQNGDRWAFGSDPALNTERRKRAGQEGPIQNAFSAPFVIVFGDMGPDAGALEAAARKSAERWERRHAGRVEVVAESKLDSKLESTRNFVLYATAGSSKRLGELTSLAKVDVTTGGIGIGSSRFAGQALAAQFILPNPRAAGRYTVVVTGQSAEHLGLLGGDDRLKPDYVVVDPTYLDVAPTSVQGAGFFDIRWAP